jgi:16S rRNA processing protein RimM
MASPEELVCLGVINAAHGIRGEVKIRYYTGGPEGLLAYGIPLSEDGSRSFDIKIVGEAKGQLIARIAGVNNRNDAEKLKQQKLYVPRENLPDTPSEDEFYYEDLIGMDVMTESGDNVGKVRQVHNHGAGDLLEIQHTNKKRDFYAFNKETFPTIDLPNRQLTFIAPEEIS